MYSTVQPRKPELIIRENEPKELPPDVIRGNIRVRITWSATQIKFICNIVYPF